MLTFDKEIKVKTATGSAMELFEYDTYNRLISYENDDTYAEYGYNAEDYRSYKSVQNGGISTETYYFYNGSHVIMEADADGSITARNMYGTNLAFRTVDGQTCYYLYNAHGDVVMLTDADTGDIAATYQYDAFGTLLQSNGYADNNITYAGYQYDEESGLYYLNARYYDSVTARFLTEDTYRGKQEDPLSLNLYTYCHNNPLMYTDPTGHTPQKYEKDYFISVETGERHPRCKLGSAGSYVHEMERKLEYAGYNPGNSLDGIFDECTLDAVQQFQKDNGLNVTGIVEQKNWAYLQIQPDLIELKKRYQFNDISEEEYEAQVYRLKIKADRVPYLYDDITPEDVEREMYSRYCGGLNIANTLFEMELVLLSMGVSEVLGDGADLAFDLYDVAVNPSLGAVGSVVFDTACLFLPDGPLNYVDNVADDAVDFAKRAGKSDSVPDFYVGPNGKALPSQYKDWIGTNIQKELLDQAENPQLQNAIKQLYRGNSFIGDGGTADVIRFEQQIGLMLGNNGGSHVQKGIDMAKYIENKILTQDLSPSDRALAMQLLEDLYRALGR